MSVDGPSLAVRTRLTVPGNPQTIQPSGYTALEEWLHNYATGVEISANQTAPPTPAVLRILSS